jgi:hypothetical protein
MTDDALPGGRFAAPIREGDTVTRLTGPGAANIHALVEHLAHHGLSLAPRALGTTADRQREILTYLPGAGAHPPLPAAVRSDRPLRSAARAVRALHDAGEGFVPPQPGVWGYQEVTAPVECSGSRSSAPEGLAKPSWPGGSVNCSMRLSQ